MTRPIKFRAWDEQRHVMLPVHSMMMGMSYREAPGAFFNHGHPKVALSISDDAPLMQFTGLLDKNGKEIYEGDVLQHYDFFQKPTEKLEVRYALNGFGYFEKDKPETKLWFNNESIEVVGNIYEHPELLTL